MKILYFDCFAGAAGDMILGSLIDSGLSIEKLKHELLKLNVDGWVISSDKSVKNGITGTKLSVKVEKTDKHRHLKDIKIIINDSELSDKTKFNAIAIFEIIARAEAKVHNTSVDKIHFHEVGALDAIIDIVGTVIGLDLLGIEAVYCSPIHLGSGFVECEHGRIPLPSPATIEILQDCPVFSEGIQSELTTPTGAAILKYFTKQFGPIPTMNIISTGYGAGTRNLKIPNLIRAVIGNTDNSTYETDRVVQLETCIDDISPELIAYAMEKLRDAGVLDLYLTPIQMKKNRPAFHLTILAKSELVEKLLNILFTETTTIGIRYQTVDRYILPRKSTTVMTELGKVRIKVTTLPDGKTKNSPEYEDCKRLAEDNSLPLKDVYALVLNAAEGFKK